MPGATDPDRARAIISLTRAGLAFATGEPNTALCIVNGLIATALNIGNLDDRDIPRLSLLRGKALTALDRYGEAEAALTAAAETTAAQGAMPAPLAHPHRARSPP